jgi:adenosylcobinamide-GDP ribazoletransferase
VDSLLAALGFLTIVRLPGQERIGTDQLARSTIWFPLVGLFIGLVCGLLGGLLFRFLPPLPAAVLCSFLLLAASGGMHMDGLVDSADGLFSARNRQRMLEIMRDSRIGSMGAIALVLVLLVKSSSLSVLAPGQAALALVLAPLAGRTAIVVMMAVLPYARPEGGLATVFYTRRSRLHGLLGLTLLLVGLLLVPTPGTLWVLVPFLVVVLGFARMCRQKLGGATGDTLGAACELAETVVLVSFSVISI